MSTFGIDNISYIIRVGLTRIYKPDLELYFFKIQTNCVIKISTVYRKREKKFLNRHTFTGGIIHKMA